MTIELPLLRRLLVGVATTDLAALVAAAGVDGDTLPQMYSLAARDGLPLDEDAKLGHCCRGGDRRRLHRNAAQLAPAVGIVVLTAFTTYCLGHHTGPVRDEHRGGAGVGVRRGQGLRGDAPGGGIGVHQHRPVGQGAPDPVPGYLR